jgi:hypothetical protein
MGEVPRDFWFTSKSMAPGSMVWCSHLASTTIPLGMIETPLFHAHEDLGGGGSGQDHGPKVSSSGIKTDHSTRGFSTQVLRRSARALSMIRSSQSYIRPRIQHDAIVTDQDWIQGIFLGFSSHQYIVSIVVTLDHHVYKGSRELPSR